MFSLTSSIKSVAAKLARRVAVAVPPSEVLIVSALMLVMRVETMTAA